MNLSFDPAHAWFDVPDLDAARWTVEVFTTENVYGIDPAQARFDGRSLTASGLQLLGGQRQAVGGVDATATREADGSTRWTISVHTPEIVKGVKLLLRDLPVSRDRWTPTTAADTWLTPAEGRPVLLRYPWDSWQTPWVCAGEGPGLTLSVHDPLVRAKRFYAYEPPWADGVVAEIVCDESATRRSTRFEAPEIRLRPCLTQAEIKSDFNVHLGRLERVYGLTAWEERVDRPVWSDELDLVLTLHGQHWTGFVFNTFDQMAAILEDVAGEVPGERILAYLPGWEGRYYWQYPVYGPGEDLGGSAGFARLVETAQRLGVHLMPMFGANGANVGRYPDWQRAAFRSPSDRYVALVNSPDWDNDRAPEDDQVFLNPGEPAFRDHLATQICSLVERYDLEGVFLDTSACWFDDPHHDLYEGYRALVAVLRRRHPELLVCGEGWYDALLALFPMNQTWIESSEQPRFDELPMRYARLLGHLQEGAPGSGSTGVHEAGTNRHAPARHVRGHVSTLSVVDDTFTTHQAEALAFCQAARRRS